MSFPEPVSNLVDVARVKPDPKATYTSSSESCCKENGVPDYCMGLCMDPKYASRSVLEDACDKFKQTAKKCFYGISTYFKAFPAAAEGRVDVTNTMDQFIQFYLLLCAS